jgi:Scramblase
MHSALQCNEYTIQPNRGHLQIGYRHLIMAPGSNDPILVCRELGPGPFSSLLRWAACREWSPFNIIVETPSGEQVLRVTRSFSCCSSHAEIRDEADQFLGYVIYNSFSTSFSLKNESDQDLSTVEVFHPHTNLPRGRMPFSVKNLKRIETAQFEQVWDESLLTWWTRPKRYEVKLMSMIPFDGALRYLILASILCTDALVTARVYKSERWLHH